VQPRGEGWRGGAKEARARAAEPKAFCKHSASCSSLCLLILHCSNPALKTPGPHAPASCGKAAEAASGLAPGPPRASSESSSSATGPSSCKRCRAAASSAALSGSSSSACRVLFSSCCRCGPRGTLPPLWSVSGEVAGPTDGCGPCCTSCPLCASGAAAGSACRPRPEWRTPLARAAGSGSACSVRCMLLATGSALLLPLLLLGEVVRGTGVRPENMKSVKSAKKAVLAPAAVRARLGARSAAAAGAGRAAAGAAGCAGRCCRCCCCPAAAGRCTTGSVTFGSRPAKGSSGHCRPRAATAAAAAAVALPTVACTAGCCTGLAPVAAEAAAPASLAGGATGLAVAAAGLGASAVGPGFAVAATPFCAWHTSASCCRSVAFSAVSRCTAATSCAFCWASVVQRACKVGRLSGAQEPVSGDGCVACVLLLFL
jgi:hypothetical protein